METTKTTVTIAIILLTAITFQTLILPYAAFAQTTPAPTTPTAPTASSPDKFCGLTKEILDITGVSSLLSSLKSTISGFIGSTVGSLLGTAGVPATIIPEEVPVNEPRLRAFAGAIETKEFICDPVLKFFAATLIRSLTDTIIGWIQGEDGTGSQVGFIGNFEEELRNQINARGGEFLNTLAGVNLCGNIGAFLQVSLRVSTSLKQRFECTVTDIVANVEDFFTDFSRGGWPAFIRLSLQPQNNPYGAFLLGLDAMTNEQASAALGLDLRAKTGVGFEGEYVTFQRCSDVTFTQTTEPTGLDLLNPDGTAKNPSVRPNPDGTYSLCYTEKLIKTPGALVANMLQKSVGTGIDLAIVADEVNEAVQAIILALINELIRGGASGGGIFNPNLTTATEENPDGLPPVGAELEELNIITVFLPIGTVGIPYSTQLEAINGALPHDWSLLSGFLPAGLSLSIDGVISGTPIVAGFYNFEVDVIDGAGATDTQELSLEIISSATPPPPEPGATPGGTAPPAGVTYNLTVTPLVCNTSLPTNLLGWDPYPDATSYTIFSCQGENCVFSAGSQLVVVQDPETTYPHTGVFPNTFYTYSLTPFIGSIQASVPGVYPEVDIKTDSCD